MFIFQEDPLPGFELAWHDREGRRTAPSEPGGLRGRRALARWPTGGVSIADPGTTNRDLWIFDVARGLRTRSTTNPRPRRTVLVPGWDRVAFDSRRKGHRHL